LGLKNIFKNIDSFQEKYGIIIYKGKNKKSKVV